VLVCEIGYNNLGAGVDLEGRKKCLFSTTNFEILSNYFDTLSFRQSIVPLYKKCY
jgi:hypothetical protein